MSVLHWWAIGIGIIALGAPLAVHMLTRPQPIAFPLSTVQFLEEIIQQRKARSRLRDWIILLLRCLCVALLALGLARPLLDAPAAVVAEQPKKSTRVIILDVSQSMQAGSGGVSAWSGAQANALQFLSGTGDLDANVIFAGATATAVFDSLSPNMAGLRRAVQKAVPHAERANSKLAFELAGRMLADSNSEKRELVIISDFQRSNWASLSWGNIPPGTDIQLHSVADQTRENIAITGVNFEQQPIVGQSTAIVVEIANYSQHEREIRCRLDIAGQQQVLRTKLRPQEVRSLTAGFVFREAGWIHGWAQLESNSDALQSDDSRPIAGEVRKAVRVGLLTRQPASEIPSSSYFLQRAIEVTLAADREREASEKPESQTVTRINPLRLAPRSWPECDIWVLDHPGSLSDEAVELIASQLRRGKGMLYVTAELVDAMNLKRLADVWESDFQPPVTLVPPGQGQLRKGLSVQSVSSRQPPFRLLGDSGVSMLRTARFHGGLATKPEAEGLKDQILAELTDTSALLYVTSVGAGQLAVLNADLGNSNWCIQPTFLPVTGQLLSVLLQSGQDRDVAFSGEPLIRMLPPSVGKTAEITGQTITGPEPEDGEFGNWKWSASQNAMVWNWPHPPGSGVYQLQHQGATCWIAATAAPPAESDLAALDQDVLKNRVSADRQVGYSRGNAQKKRTDTLWSWLIVGCLVGLLAEVAALRLSKM